MTKFCLSLSLLLMVLASPTLSTVEVVSSGWRGDLEEIDSQIQQLEEEQIRLKMSATRWDNKGGQWQFQQGMTQEAKRAFQKADADRAQMVLNQNKIDALKQRRETILQKHPEANANPSPSQ